MKLKKYLNIWYEAQEARRSGDYAKAADLYKECAAFEPKTGTFKLAGECYFRQKRYNEAVLFLGAAVGISDGNVSAMFLLAEALVNIGETTHATKTLIKLLNKDKNHNKAKSLLNKLCLDDKLLRDIVKEESEL